MADNSEFGEFSSVSEGWGQQNHVTTSFTPDWLAYSDNQDWVSGAIPNNEHQWNTSFPELPKELSNLLSDEITSFSDSDVLNTNIISLSTSGCGHDEFGDFECSLSNPMVVMTTNNPIIEVNVPVSSQTGNNDSSAVSKSQSWTTGEVGGVNLAVDEDDDEFGDFEGPSIPKKPDTVQSPNAVVNDVQDEAEDEFGGFVSTTTSEVKEKITADDDFGSFETAEYVAASSIPPIQPIASTVGFTPSSFGATPASMPPPTFSAVAENCFHCSNQTVPQSTITDQPLNTLAEESR